ncbi:unnamed protein product [Moneuplotes crassus]|uniref:C2H2-type domain-containing protein n=1 Tax=Euplotes crassus TaxID=5936 RepID=A0AAD1UG68_EUPCR|nr:unnamed protein product [Moneuplotes crassus]
MSATSRLKKFICTAQGCNKEYSTKFALQRHLYTHSGIKTFTCSFCPKSFSLQQYLQEHEFTHTKAKPFVCGIDGCRVAFRQRGKLCLHRSTHPSYKKKDYKVYARKINGRRSQHKPKEILPEYLKQVEEKKEHQHLLKDLKNSRTLPILPPDSISSINLTNYCLCDFQLPAKQTPSSTLNLITLPSPSPLLCESQYFFPAYWQEEQNCESTIIEVIGMSPLGFGSSGRYFLSAMDI